jgi:hypothetical protein
MTSLASLRTRGHRPPPANRRRRVVGVAALVLCSLAAGPAGADAPPPSDRYEPGVLPALAEDADVGFMFGVFAQLARFRDERKPYAWKLQLLAATSVRDGATGTEFPYREVFLRLDRPHVFVDPLRILVHVGYLRTTNLGYFGVGNATPAEPLWQGLPPGSDAYVAARRFYQFDGVTPSAKVTGRYRLAPAWDLLADLYAEWVSLNVYEASLLAQDLASAQGPGFPLGRGLQARGTLGLLRDTRNHETVATRGYFHEGSVRCGANVRDGNPYCGLNLTLRGYWGIAGEWLSIALRVLGDMEVGSPPLIELARYGGVEDGTGPGGGRGIRGVPQGRLAGKSKVITNLEVRSFLLPFSIGSQRFVLGAVAFADAGRVWANALSRSERDGSFRVHWGVGGGPRLRWGDSLLIRADIAYAPLGADLGAVPAVYVDVFQVL